MLFAACYQEKKTDEASITQRSMGEAGKKE